MSIEIRLEIYRLLLLPEAPLYLNSSKPSKTASLQDISETDNDADNDAWVDIDDESDDDESFSWLDQFDNELGEPVYNGMSYDMLEQMYYSNNLEEDAADVFEAMERREMMRDSVSQLLNILKSRSGRGGQYPGAYLFGSYTTK